MNAQVEVVRYRGAVVDRRLASGANATVSTEGVEARWAEKDGTFVVSASSSAEVADLGIDLVLTFPSWKGGYVLVPGAVYAGNRFRVFETPYPPMYDRERTDRAVVVTDVPRLPVIHLLSGDASFPAVGLWDAQRRHAQVVLFPPTTDLGYVGIVIEERTHGLTVRIQFPGVRPERYTMVDTRSTSPDRGAWVAAGWTMEAHVVSVAAEDTDLGGLFTLLDENRHRCVPPAVRTAVRPLSAAASLVREVTMRERWHESPGFFETADSDHGTPFQVGWTGGGITSFALLESPDPLARDRARRNVDFACQTLQAPSGFFYGGYGEGPVNDGFGHAHAEHWAMVRKSGDMLLFLMRHVAAVENAPASWLASACRCAEAFVRNGDGWGQFVDVRDGRVVVGGSACGGTALAGLALASKRFDEPRFLLAAGAAGDRYATDCLRPGLLTGGPGEILKAPDSESAFGLLEGYVVLWETTGEAKWLELAQETARQAASWVVPYDFPFPLHSTFGQMGIRTAGTVIANVQNKHSAPGICTLSALSLLKLYRATGEPRWLHLAVEISHALPQYVSSAERPIPAEDGRPMPSGWINERVNMSDWEAPERGVGEAFYGPCWPMASLLLTALEMPGVYVDPSRGIVACADHVEATLQEGRLRVHNPTDYDARVKVLIDQDRDRPLGELWWRRAACLHVPAQGSAEMPPP